MARSPRDTSASSTPRSSRPTCRIWCLSRLRLVSLALFRRLAVVTAIFAYLQIALGGVVRVTGSGLGCPDWPLGHGRPYPPANLGSVIEDSHRAGGSVTELVILAPVFGSCVVWASLGPVRSWRASAAPLSD